MINILAIGLTGFLDTQMLTKLREQGMGNSIAQTTSSGNRARIDAMSIAPSPGYSRSSRIVRRASSIVAGTSARSSET